MDIMKRFASALLTVSTVLIGSTSVVLADDYSSGGFRNQSGTVQDSYQGTVITGDGNVSDQYSEQVNSIDRRDSNGSTDVIMQRSTQACDVMGNGSACVQTIKQNNRVSDQNTRYNR
jgi:hypothetical protein